jgi:cytidylate kinase
MIDVEDLVRKQIALFRAFDIRADRAEQPGRGKEGKLTYGPYLLISREKGAGGTTVAELVGKRLGWQVFNNKIVDEIAQKANVRRQLIESLDERDQATIEGIVGQLLHPQHMRTSAYLAYLKEIVLALGNQGRVVIVGRGAQYILPSQFGLNVRMVAPVEQRVRRIAADEGLSLKAARAKIESVDRGREHLVRRYFDQDVADPLNHDLTINTAELSLEQATEIVLAALRQKLAVQFKERGQKAS